MESCGVWCRTALCSVQVTYPGALPRADPDPTNQASTKIAFFQQVKAGAVMAVLRDADKVAARAIPVVLVPIGPARARRPGVPSRRGGRDGVLGVRQRRPGRPGQSRAARMARQPRLPTSRRSGRRRARPGNGPGCGVREQASYGPNHYSILALTKSPHRRAAEVRERRPGQGNVRGHRYRSRMDGGRRPGSARTVLPTTATTLRLLPIVAAV